MSYPETFSKDADQDLSELQLDLVINMEKE
jgi:hypothetical protein